jgi:transcriptional regulator with XRE-family HTH domain
VKPSEICKREGLKLCEVSEITGVSEQTLINWSKSKGTKSDKSKLFLCAVIGAVQLKSRDT